MLKTIRAKRDVEFSMLRGAYQYPTDNTTGRKMRGMRNAISTTSRDLNAVIGTAGTCTFDFTGGAAEDLWTADAAHSLAVGDEVQFTTAGTGATEYAADTPYWVAAVPSTTTFQLSATKGGAVLAGTADSIGTWTCEKSAQVTKSDFDRVMRDMTEDGGAPFVQPVLLVGAFGKQRASDIYGYAPESRNIGGLNIESIVTDLAGNVGIVFDRYMHPGDIYLVDLSVCAPAFMPIPGKGHFFAEPLAQSGAAWKWQLYGEITLEYGPEQWHGKIIGSTTA
jgi:hypothetical protein